jgi:hypothetical protein
MYTSIARGALGMVTMLMIGCGSPDEAATTKETAASGAATGAGVSDESAPRAATRPRNCPPTLSTPESGAEAPVYDILGVRPGQSFDDVYAILACRDQNYSLDVADRWLLRDTGELTTRQAVRATNGVPCSGQEIARNLSSVGSGPCAISFSGSNLPAVRDTTDQVHVAFTGLLDEEVAGAVWRSQTYKDDAQPSVENLEQALIAKYGSPSTREEMKTHSYGMRRGDIAMSWVYDLRGRKVGAESPVHQQCLTISPSFHGSHRWSGSCGTTIRAAIRKNSRNELLAEVLDIGVMDQKSFYEGGEKFKADIAAAIEQQHQDAARHAATVTPEL